MKVCTKVFFIYVLLRLIADKKLCAVVNTSIEDERNWSPLSCDSLNTAVCRKPLGE